MNNSELDKKLLAARTPPLGQDYENDFAPTVLARVRENPRERPARENRWLPRLAWAGGMAFACLILVFAVSHGRQRAQTESAAAGDILENAKLIRETLAMFPNRVRAIVRDEHGLNLVLSDDDNVPDSTPLYIHICDGKECASVVTFSGQDFRIAGRQMTALSDAQGGIILMGKNFAWSSRERALAKSSLEIEARPLTAAM
jgi:hypothetical protein